MAIFLDTASPGENFAAAILPLDVVFILEVNVILGEMYGLVLGLFL